jgi:DNA repair protein RadA/Sms
MKTMPEKTPVKLEGGKMSKVQQSSNSQGMSLDLSITGLPPRTNILDIQVPDHLRNRQPTKIRWVDTALCGGLVPSQVVMLTGVPGSGKTTLTLQIADSLTRSGHVALYNTGEESLYQTRLVAERLKLKSGFLVGQDYEVTELLNKADDVIKHNPGKQVFLFHDSLQTLDDGKNRSGNTPVRCCEMLTNWAKRPRAGNSYGIVVFIGQATKSGDFAGKNTIRHMVDTHAVISYGQTVQSSIAGQRCFGISKNRFGSVGNLFPITLHPEKGCVPSP